MRNFVLAALAACAIFVVLPSKAQAACDDRFQNTCDIRAWHWTDKTRTKSEFRAHRRYLKHHSSSVQHRAPTRVKTTRLTRVRAKAVAGAAIQGAYATAQIVSHPDGCPRTAFCGCGVAKYIFGQATRSLWLAANWFRFPRAEPAAGMVAVRKHHVFAIAQVLDRNRVIAYDPNSGGHLTRIHVRSLAGYTVVNPHGGKG